MTLGKLYATIYDAVMMPLRAHLISRMMCRENFYLCRHAMEVLHHRNFPKHCIISGSRYVTLRSKSIDIQVMQSRDSSSTRKDKQQYHSHQPAKHHTKTGKLTRSGVETTSQLSLG